MSTKLENDNVQFARELAEMRLEFPPREVTSVADIFGGFGQDKILVDGKYVATKRATNGPFFDVTFGEPNQAADYLFALDNGHGLSARIYGDGKIEAMFLSTVQEDKRLTFEELIVNLRELDKLTAKV